MLATMRRIMKFTSLFTVVAAVAIAPFAFSLSAIAQDQSGKPAPAAGSESEAPAEESEFEKIYNSLNWKTEGEGELSEWATIKIPEGYRHLRGLDSDGLMQALGNLPDNYEGMISTDDLGWFVLFQFDDSGYVKDDEKDELDADALLESIQEGDEEGNNQRKAQGLEALYTEGWAIKPKYNESTNNLEWGIILRDESGDRNVNYNTKLLGRHGVMHVTLVCDPEELEAILPVYQKLLSGYTYKPGKTYGEYEEGDKVAAYGLTALVAGGALYGAAKLGLLAKFGAFFGKFFKIIAAGVVAVGIGIKKFFGKVTGGSSDGRIS